MTTKISLELADTLYQKVKDFAQQHQQPVDEAISIILEERFDVDPAGEDEEIIDLTEPDPAMDREKAAYITLHPSLKERYFGKYVAIYHGELVDFDDDPAVLGARIDKRYPNEF